MCRGGVAELEAPPPLMGEDAAGSRVSMGDTASQCRMRVVEVREAQAAAVAKAFCQPSEFNRAVCQMLARSHIAISDVNATWSRPIVFPCAPSLILHVSTRSTRLMSFYSFHSVLRETTIPCDNDTGVKRRFAHFAEIYHSPSQC